MQPDDAKKTSLKLLGAIFVLQAFIAAACGALGAWIGVLLMRDSLRDCQLHLRDQRIAIRRLEALQAGECFCGDECDCADGVLNTRSQSCACGGMETNRGGK